ncbi:FAD/NAD(P)-binding protein [uncultured Shewanella sp.]|uniref:FAD/NAD(P)-binding protein n=1 Tax=uncultured Shewanella sp. TaxID=173975 RepID=UPI0026270DA8|nr:FAD/NAD(P)-binding protein [uncultured Shewanella sp.]
MKSMCIVGGGSSAIILLISLIKYFCEHKDIHHFNIKIVEKRERVGAGMAYSSHHSCNILNNRIDEMGIVAGSPNHFVEWLSSRDEEAYGDIIKTTDDLLMRADIPRSVYSEYLNDVANLFCLKGKEIGVKVEFIQDEILDIERREAFSDYALYGKNHTINADYICLCLGPQQSTTFDEFDGISHFIPSPYPDKDLAEKIPKHSSVVIAGTGPSGIDALLTLKTAGHKGKILWISRNGFHHRVQGLSCDYQLKYITFDRLNTLISNGVNLSDNIFQLVLAEIKAAENEEFDTGKLLPTVDNPLTWFTSELKKSQTARPWLNALALMDHLFQHYWDKIPPIDKIEWLSKYQQILSINRTALPQENARRLIQYLDDGTIVTGYGIDDISYLNSCNRFTISLSHSSTGENDFEQDFFVNATGIEVDIRKYQSTLLQNLLARGMIAPHPFGGINVSRESLNVIDQGGKPVDAIYVAGHSASGVYPITNSPGIVRQVNLIVKSISGK